MTFNELTPHPSLHTVIPILGTALVIGFSSREELVGRILGSKQLVSVGLISYSLYLWHFPIFAFFRRGEVSTNCDKLLWITVTVILSVASYYLIEKPFRNRKVMSSKKLLIILTAAAASTLPIMFYVIYSDGIFSRFSAREQSTIKHFVELEYRAFMHPAGKKGTILLSNELSVECTMRKPAEACRYGDERFVFLGDSYVAHYVRAFVDTLDVGFISLTHEQCPFVSTEVWFGEGAECPYVNEQRRLMIAGFNTPKIFIVSANTDQFYFAKKRVENPLADGRKDRRDGEPFDSALARQSYFDNISWLIERGHRVVLIRTIPKQQIDGKDWIMDNIGRMMPDIYNESKPSNIKAEDNQLYPEFTSPSVMVLDPANALCDDINNLCLDVVEGLGPIYNGGRHLSYFGAKLVAKLLQQRLIDHGWIEN